MVRPSLDRVQRSLSGHPRQRLPNAAERLGVNDGVTGRTGGHAGHFVNDEIVAIEPAPDGRLHRPGFDGPAVLGLAERASVSPDP